MTMPLVPFRLSFLLCLALPACHGAPVPPAGTEQPMVKGDLITLTPAQQAKLGITLAAAQGESALPLGTVPGVVTLPPEARVAVTTPFAGTVTRVLVIAGQAVSKGQVLAMVRAAEAVQFGAALARSQAQLPVAQARSARLSQLAAEGIIAPARADEARAALAAEQATVAEHRRLLALAGASGDGTIMLRAPIAGIVASVGVETGGAVGTAPFVIENTAHLRLDLQIPEGLAAQVRPGMAVRVEQDGAVVSGRLLSVGASIDPMTRAVAAKAHLDGGALAPGKGVMAVIAGGGSGVSVPAAAVARIEGVDQVFVRQGKGLRRVPVTVAGQIGGRAFIAAGLKPGEQVVVTGVADLKSIAGQ